MSAGNVIAFPVEAPEVLPRVKPGGYHAVYVRHEGMNVFGSNKLKVLFRLVEHCDLILPRWYPVTAYKGRVAASAHSHLVRELSTVLGTKVRHDRIPVSMFANIVLVVNVDTVTVDYHQEPLDPVNQYEVISKVRGKA